MARQTYPIPEEYQDRIDIVTKEVQEARWAYHEACFMGRRAQDKLWGLLHEMYPELEGKDVGFDHKNQLVFIDNDEHDTKEGEYDDQL